MKILCITSTIDPKSGGWGRYSKEVVDNLRALGHWVDVVESGMTDGPISFVRNVLKIRRKLADNEVVHALDGWPYAVFSYFAVLGRTNKMFISGIGTYSVPQGNILKVFLMKCAYRKASCVFAISNYTASKIRASTKKARVEVIHMGTTYLPELSDIDKNERAERFNISHFYPMILTVGEIKSRKGQYDTLGAIEKLSVKYPDIGYVMLGNSNDGHYRRRIEKFMVENNLEGKCRIVTDLKSDKDLAFFYSTCDVLTLNSRNEDGHFEGFGLVILEAGMFGKPSVGSTNCGIEDAIKEGETGFLVPQGDEYEIASAIEKALALDPKEIENYCRSFNWRKTVERYVGFYNE